MLHCAQVLRAPVNEGGLGAPDRVGAVGTRIQTHGQVEADVAALKRASKTLDRLLAAKSLDLDAVVAELKPPANAQARPRNRCLGWHEQESHRSGYQYSDSRGTGQAGARAHSRQCRRGAILYARCRLCGRAKVLLRAAGKKRRKQRGGADGARCPGIHSPAA